MRGSKVIWTAIAALGFGVLSLVWAFTEPKLSVPFGIFALTMAILATRERV
jgi:hypothetical protein